MKGKKTKIIMLNDPNNEIIEDLHDLSVIAERKNDKSIPLEKVYSELKKNGLI